MAADRYNSSYPDDLVLPFVFVPHGEPERPEVAEFKARYPDWFAIPATFVPHPRPAEALAGPSRGLDTGHRRPVAPPPRPGSGTDWDGAVRAFRDYYLARHGQTGANRAGEVPVLTGSAPPSRTPSFDPTELEDDGTPGNN